MGDTDRIGFSWDNSFVRELEGLYEPWTAAVAPAPKLLVLNEALAEDLGLDPKALGEADGTAVLVGNVVPEGAEPVAQAYAGHQFGGYSPRLGDGRALLLGELHDIHANRRDLHLKGSGRTPFARGGDGRAAVGPMLREYVISEAMHALGIPTTRSLAVIATGEQVRRDTMLPGAVLARVAASHLRIGTFQYAAAAGDTDLVRRLADYAIRRHHPGATTAPNPYLVFFEAVLDAQARLVAQWMLVGFIHGVMNTDNTTISGETIDYGPCAFMDAFDPATVFSSIDHGGRYAFGNQPQILQWNLARLAETLLPLLHEDPEVAVAQATEVLATFPERYGEAWLAGMRAKLGWSEEHEGDLEIVNDLLRLLHEQQVDLTVAFRSLSSEVRGAPSQFGEWSDRHLARVRAEGREPSAVADAMDQVNPIYVPRNHLVEEALDAATAEDLGPFHQLLAAVSQPFHERPGLERYALAAPAEVAAGYQTFCGT